MGVTKDKEAINDSIALMEYKKFNFITMILDKIRNLLRKN